MCVSISLSLCLAVSLSLSHTRMLPNRWTQHTDKEEWHISRAWQPKRWLFSDVYRNASAHAFHFAKALGLDWILSSSDRRSNFSSTAARSAGRLNRTSYDDGRPRLQLRLCNGMIPYAGYVFDHMHGWLGRNFSFGFAIQSSSESNAENILPCEPSVSLPLLQDDESYFQRDCVSKMACGCRSSSESHAREGQCKHRVHLVNLHYQGRAKAYLPYDVCRALYMIRSKGSSQFQWQFQSTAALCQQLLRSRQMNFSNIEGDVAGKFPCLKRDSTDTDSELSLCF